MIKICDTSTCRPLKLIFLPCLESGKFPNEWKKANLVPVHKKGDKQILKNYRPISLLAGKILERLLYDRMFEFFIANNLISKNQSGFRPGDSCINQLLSITQEIYQSVDDNLEVRAVFKAFNPIQDGLFWGCSWIAGGRGGGETGGGVVTVIPYPKKIQKIYDSRDTPLEFC